MSEKDFESTKAMEQAFIDFADSKGFAVGRHNGRESMAHLGLDSPARYDAEIWLRLHQVVFVDVKSVTAGNEGTGNGSISMGCLLHALKNTETETYFVQYPGPGHEDAEGLVQGWTYGEAEWLLRQAKNRPCCGSCWGLFDQGLGVPRVCPNGNGDQPYLLYHLDGLKPINELLFPNGEPPSESV